MSIVLRTPSPADRVSAGPSFYTEAKSEEGGFWDAAGAAYINENSIGSWVADQEHQITSEAVEGYDQYQDIPEDLSDQPISTWRGVTSPEEMQGRIAEVYAERQRLEAMGTSGWGAFWGGMGGILTSPEIIPDLFVGRGQGALRGAVKLGASTLAAEGTHEYIMHQENYTRTMNETYVNMGLAAFGGVAVGSLISRKASTDTLDFMRKDLEDAAKPGGYMGGDLSAGALRTFDDVQGGDEIINKPWLRWRVLGPVRPLAHSESKVAQAGLHDIAENSYTPAKVQDDVEKQFAVETDVNMEVGARMRQIKNVTNANYKKWLKDTGARRVRDFRKNWRTFNEEVHMALVSGDTSVSKAPGYEVINATAKSMRAQFNELLATAKQFDPDGKWIEVDEFQVKYANSYAPRRYNQRAIRKNPQAFRQLLTKAFVKERQKNAYQEAIDAGKDVKLEDFPAQVEELDDAGLKSLEEQVEKTFQRIAYSYDQDVYMPISGTGKPYAERKVPIDDKELMPWLESDIDGMMRSYMNRILKPARLVQRGYDPELENLITAIDKDYAKMARGVDEKTAKKLNEANRKDREAYQVIRDRFYGRTTISTSSTNEAVNDAMRTIRNFNVSRMMGMVLPISVGDVFRANLTSIYAPELGKAAPGLIQAIKTAKASKKMMQQFGVAHETAMMVRSGKIFDDSGLEGSSRWVEGSAAASRGLMKATGLMAWTDWGKLLAASYTQNDIAQKMRGFARLSTRSKKQLADLGINSKWAKRFQAEVKAQTGGIQEMGKNTTGYDGVGYVFDYAKWKDQELAQHIQKVLFRESERNIVSPAVGEVPRLTHSDEVNKMIFQFQNFLFGAAHSVTVNLGKRVRDRDPKGFQILTQLMLGGMVSVGLREAAYGNIEELEGWTPQDWVLNAMDYSTMTPLAMMAFNQVNLATGNAVVNGIGATSMSRYAHRPLGSLLGPSFGTAEDSLVAIQSMAGIPFGDHLSPSDIRRLRRLIPWNNLMYVAAPVSAAQEQIEEMVE